MKKALENQIEILAMYHTGWNKLMLTKNDLSNILGVKII